MSVYFDNAATTKIDSEAASQMYSLLCNEYGNPSQLYSISKKTRSMLEDARKEVANAIGAKSHEIFFTSGGSESNNWAIRGTYCHCLNSNVISTSIEHHSVLNVLGYQKSMGEKIFLINPSDSGHIVPSSLSDIIDDNTRLVSVMLVNNEIGTIQPIKELSKISHSYGALFHTDAVQAIGHMNIDVNELGVDLLSASAHKFNGPKGVGFLYIREGTSIKPLIFGGSQESNYRAGTENVPAIVAMSIALKNNLRNLNQNICHIHTLEKQLLIGLKERNIPFVLNSKSPRIPGILSLSFPGFEGESLLIRLDLKGVCVSTGSACNSKQTEVSHVLKAIDLHKDVAESTIRISIGKDNQLSDVNYLLDLLKSICL